MCPPSNRPSASESDVSTPGPASSGWSVSDSSSIEENGRTYNGYREGKYILPNDGIEQDRLDFQHQLFMAMMDNELYWAPIGEPANVLDIGTGTGIWALRVAEKHPNSNVVGTDISLIQPDTGVPNCRFIREDTEDDWSAEVDFNSVHPRSAETDFNSIQRSAEIDYDYIHLRAMCTCFDNAETMVHKAFRQLKPGGWVEYQDIIPEQVAADEESEKALQADRTSWREWVRLGSLGLKNSLGRDMDVTRHLKKWMIEAGFVDVVEKTILAPMNAWPLDPKDKLIGHYMVTNAHDAAIGSEKALRAAGLSAEEVQEFLRGFQNSIRNSRIRSYIVWAVVHGRKPEDAPSDYPEP